MMSYPEEDVIDEQSLSHIVYEALEYAKRLLQKDGGVIPVAFIFAESGDIVLLVLPFNTDQEKFVCRTALKDTVKRLAAVAVVFISEAWVATIGPDRNLFDVTLEGVENIPDREEALIVVGVTKENLSFKASQTFQRKEEDFIFGELDGTSTPAVFDAFVDNLWDLGTVH